MGHYSIWKHSVLVFCFNRGCLNSHITQRGRQTHISRHINTHKEVQTDGVIERGNSALKIEPLKRVGRAAGGETSADKRQEKREGERKLRSVVPD